MDWRTWAKGLASTVISGAATGLSLTVIDPSTFNLSTGANRLLVVMLVSGLVAGANYLKQSPIPNGR